MENKKLLKILLIADVSIANVIGGAERVLYEQSIRLAQRGHLIHIITRKLPLHKKYHENICGVSEWRYEGNYTNPFKFLFSTIKNGKLLFEKLYNKYDFDCINFHQPFSALGINLSDIGNGLPKIYTCHSLSFEEFISRDIKGNGIWRKGLSFIQIQARREIEKYGLKKSKFITVLSRFTKDKLINAYNIPGKKIKTIPGGVDLQKFHPSDDKASIRKQLNIPHDKVVLFTVRNLVQRMGLENLIIAFHQLEKEVSDIYLVIGGKGPLEYGLIALTRSLGIEEKIKFTGFISEEKLPLYYQMADLFVLPTKELEGFGLVSLEAMASGLPVLGTPVGGTKEIIGGFDSSFLFKGTNPHSIAELIYKKYILLKQNPRKWNEFSYRCRNFIERNYSWEKNVDALEQLFAETGQN